MNITTLRQKKLLILYEKSCLMATFLVKKNYKQQNIRGKSLYYTYIKSTICM